MLEDISFEKVKDVAVAVIPAPHKEADKWDVYLLNLKDDPIHSVVVRSKGYGTLDGKEVKTSTLRQFFDKIPKRQFSKIELIQTKIFGLHNEFWISFRCNGQVYDKKYIFVPDSISQLNFIEIPLLEKKGVMIK